MTSAVRRLFDQPLAWSAGAAPLGLAALGIAVVVLTSTGLGVRILGLTPVELGHLLGASAGVVLLAGVAGFREGYIAGLWLLASLVPGLAAVLTVVVYVTGPTQVGGQVPREPGVAVYLGLTATLLVWGAAGFLGSQLARRERAQLREYGALVQRYGQLRTRIDALPRPPAGGSPDGPPAELDARERQVRTAAAEARARMAAAEAELVGDAARRPGCVGRSRPATRASGGSSIEPTKPSSSPSRPRPPSATPSTTTSASPGRRSPTGPRCAGSCEPGAGRSSRPGRRCSAGVGVARRRPSLRPRVARSCARSDSRSTSTGTTGSTASSGPGTA